MHAGTHKWPVCAGLLFLIGATTLFLGFKTQLTCICDVTCTSIATPGAPTPGGGSGGSINPAPLRNETQWQEYCSKQDSVVSSLNVYVVMGAIALVLQCVSCCLSFPLATDYAKGEQAGYTATRQQQPQPVAVPIGVMLHPASHVGSGASRGGGSTPSTALATYESPYASPYAVQPARDAIT